MIVLVLVAVLVQMMVVRDKSNSKIGHENYPKTVRFF